MTLEEKLVTARARLDNLQTGISMMQARSGKKGSALWTWNWKEVLRSVEMLENTIRQIRTSVRAQERKERRANCTHPPDRRFNDGTTCRNCGQKALEAKQETT